VVLLRKEDMRIYMKRSEGDRRRAINDVEYFARGAEERRSPHVDRRQALFTFPAAPSEKSYSNNRSQEQ